MERHFTYLINFFPGGYDTFNHSLEKFLAAAIFGTALVFVALRASKKLQGNLQDHVVPSKSLSLVGFFDLLVSSFVAFHDSLLGRENRRHIGLTGSVFLFVLFGNLLGLVPGFPAITTTVWVNLSIALVVFFAFNLYGIQAHGVVGYLKHFAGPKWWLAWMIFPVEIFSTCLRVLTLHLRLYWNISADHLVLGTFTDMAPVVPIVFYGVGTFVSFLQAFIFTVLTMSYILLATQHEEEAH